MLLILDLHPDPHRGNSGIPWSLVRRNAVGMPELLHQAGCLLDSHPVPSSKTGQRKRKGAQLFSETLVSVIKYGLNKVGFGICPQFIGRGRPTLKKK